MPIQQDFRTLKIFYQSESPSLREADALLTTRNIEKSHVSFTVRNNSIYSYSKSNRWLTEIELPLIASIYLGTWYASNFCFQVRAIYHHFLRTNVR